MFQNPPIITSLWRFRRWNYIFTSPLNCSFMKPNQSKKVNKLHFWKRLHKDISNLIVFLALKKCDNLLLDQLSQIREMKFNMLHLTMCNRIVSDLDCTFIVTVKNNWCFERKLDLTQELSNPENLSSSINSTMKHWFSHW